MLSLYRGAALRCRRGDIFLKENCLIPRLPLSTARGSGIGFTVYKADARGSCPNLGLTLAPIDEYLKAVENNLHIAVGSIHKLLSVNADIDLVQPLFGHGNRIAVAEDRISTTVVLILIGGCDIHKPKLIAQAPVVNDKVSDFHKVRYLQRVKCQSGLHLYHITAL